MATSGTPHGGLDAIIQRAYIDGADLTLVAYGNPADSLGASTVVSDLSQPLTSNGYAPITLSGTWSSTGGVIAYSHPGNPTWTATGTWSGTVTGAAIIFGSDVWHFKDLAAPFVAAAGKKLAIDLTTVVS